MIARPHPPSFFRAKTEFFNSLSRSDPPIFLPWQRRFFFGRRGQEGSPAVRRDEELDETRLVRILLFFDGRGRGSIVFVRLMF